MGSIRPAPAAKPGDDLLFHCLSNSTIGAVWFHGRVRDGIGWVTDAMATKLWGQRIQVLETVHFDQWYWRHLAENQTTSKSTGLTMMVEFSSANRAIRTG